MQISGLCRALPRCSLLALVFAAVGCAAVPKLTLNPVGPLSGDPLPQHPSTQKGSLEVYNQRRQINDAGILYETYTPYIINDVDGRQVKSVLNRVGSMDQRPMRVPLPEGRYVLVATAEGYGRVRVPILIRARQLTQVFLTYEGLRIHTSLPNSEWVRLPNGTIVGRKAQGWNP